MKHAPSLTAWLMLGAVCSAAQPKSVINGQTQTTTPGMLTLTSSGSSSDVTAPIWVFSPSNLSTIQDINGNLNLISFSQTPVTGEVTLVSLGFAADGKTVLVDKLSVPIGFGNPNPPVPPNPTPPNPTPPNPTPPVPPGPPPAPVLPDGQYKLAAFSYNAASSLPAASRAKAPTVAGVFTTTASAINANTYPDVYSAGTALDTALNAAAPDWSAVFTAIGGQINALAGSLKIKSLADFGVALNEIANGLSQVPVTR